MSWCRRRSSTRIRRDASPRWPGRARRVGKPGIGQDAINKKRPESTRRNQAQRVVRLKGGGRPSVFGRGGGEEVRGICAGRASSIRWCRASPAGARRRGRSSRCRLTYRHEAAAHHVFLTAPQKPADTEAIDWSVPDRSQDDDRRVYGPMTAAPFGTRVGLLAAGRSPAKRRSACSRGVTRPDAQAEVGPRFDQPARSLVARIDGRAGHSQSSAMSWRIPRPGVARTLNKQTSITSILQNWLEAAEWTSPALQQKNQDHGPPRW